MIKKIISSISIVAIIFSYIGTPLVATAAQMTGVKDTLSTVTVNTTATHTITSTLVGANTLATGETIIYDFVNADFTVLAAGSWVVADFTLNDGTNRGNPVAVGAAPSCSAGANNYTVTIDATNNTFTVTTCASWTVSGAAPTITFVINGTTAVGAGTITNKATDVDSSKLTITETTDSASAAVVAETNATVNITATVDPTLTFSNDDAAIGFGTLGTGAVRYANAGATGSGTRVTAHTMAIGTNAPSGYTLTYNGATLTSGANTIPGADINADADGTAGTSQFALAGTETGGGAMDTNYDAATPNWDFIPSTVSTIATASGATSSSSIAMEYLANISASQAAGSYATNLDYVVTGNF
ncbi:MAG: hypothetical protein AAB681_00100 [Patescibacteria group bacterium]